MEDPKDDANFFAACDRLVAEAAENKRAKPMNLDLVDSLGLAHHYGLLRSMTPRAVFELLYTLHARVTGHALGCYPEGTERYKAMWTIESQLPQELLKLYRRELIAPACDFETFTGVSLDAAYHEWYLIRLTPMTRALAACRTYLLAMLKLLYEEGADHPALDALREEFSIQASEAGCGYEPDHEPDVWEEKCFDALFSPLERI